MVNIPGLPPKEELEFKEKEFAITLYEQFRSSAKVWFYLLAGMLVLYVPLKNLLVEKISDFLVARSVPVSVNLVPYSPQPLRAEKARILSVAPGVYSVVASVQNPNGDISVHRLSYQFAIRDKSGQIIRRFPDETFLLPGENKFLVLPRLQMPEAPQSAELIIGKIRWTIRLPPAQAHLEVQQKNFGLAPEGNFFVEGLVKNLQGFAIGQVEVLILVFDRARKVTAVNETLLTQLLPFENRYFRVTWPKNTAGLGASEIGEVRVLPALNPFEQDFNVQINKIF